MKNSAGIARPRKKVGANINTSPARAGGRGGQPPPGLKNFRRNSVFRASASCSKSWMIKKCFHTVKNFRAHSVFQSKRKLLKNPECKKYIQYNEKFQDTLCLSGQAQVAQKSWM